MDSSNFPILTALIVAPAAGSLVVMLAGKARPDLVKLIAWLTAIITGAMSRHPKSQYVFFYAGWTPIFFANPRPVFIGPVSALRLAPFAGHDGGICGYSNAAYSAACCCTVGSVPATVARRMSRGWDWS